MNHVFNAVHEQFQIQLIIAGSFWDGKNTLKFFPISFFHTSTLKPLENIPQGFNSNLFLNAIFIITGI